MLHREFQSNYREAKARTRRGETGIRWAEWKNPPPHGIPSDIDLCDKVEGMMLGLAIGDALGNTSESLIPNYRFDKYGRIEDYLPNRHAKGSALGLPSDDTQLAFWTLEHLISESRLEPHYLGIAFSRRPIFGIGQSVREFLRNFKAGVPWSSAGAKSAGNGALMRIAPVLIPHLGEPGPELWGDVVLAAHLTHRDELSTTACIGFVALLAEAICLTSPPPGSWWPERFIELITDVEFGQAYAPRGNHPPGFNGRLSELLRKYVMPALKDNLDVRDACDIWHSGAYCLETVPSVLYILARHGHDPVNAMLEAVNNTKDNDTIAAIVGSAVGALHGRSRLPQNWQDGLLGRTVDDDDGRVFELLKTAGEKFGYGVSDYVRSRATRASPNLANGGKDVTQPAGTPFEVKSGRFWVKVIGMLEQNWASIESDENGDVAIIFFDDNGKIFDAILSSDAAAAKAALRRNGFAPFEEGDFGKFLSPPGPRFEWGSHPNGRIYSSGRYWLGE